MYAAALLASVGAVAGTMGMPYFHMGALDIGLPIQSFGLIVAAGVLIGASLLRRYAEWHGFSDEHIRGLTGWVTIAGFIGAHEFDMIAYNWEHISDATINAPPHWWFLGESLWVQNWPLPLKLWDGISSYGGFIGGAVGFAFYVWWKRLPVRTWADVTIIGLLPAFSIGRIGCTVVSDHIGSAVDPNAWYAGLAMDYPLDAGLGPVAKLAQDLRIVHPDWIHAKHLLAWNLGLVEFLYLVPVNALILWLAFRPSKRLNAGLVTVLTGLLYAPVRFGLDFLRPEETDPRYGGLTFAQWASILAVGAALYVAMRIKKHGAPAEVIATTSGEAQRQLRMVLRAEQEKAAAEKAGDGGAAPGSKTETKSEIGSETEPESGSESEKDAKKS